MDALLINGTQILLNRVYDSIARLRKVYKSGRITKHEVNKRDYNKFLEISKDIEVFISEIAEDCKWDGLKVT